MRTSLAFLGCVLLCLSPAAAQERFRKEPPIPEPLPRLDLPKIESARLGNELTVAVAERAGQEFVCLELIILAGESHSPQNLPGLASFTAEMLTRGTPFLSFSQLEERIDSIGGQLTATTTVDLTRFTFLGLTQYLDQALEILSLIMLQPGFADEDIVSLKRTMQYDLREKQRNPEFVGRRQLLRLLFSNHPYQRSSFNEDGIKSFTKKDVQAFYDLHYRPNNAILVLTGGLDFNSAVRKATRYFRTWRPGNLLRTPLPAPPVNTVEKICLVELPQSKDAALFVGNVVFSQGDPDGFAFSVLNQILGGTPYSRLFMNLRETREYAYYAFSQTELFRNGGVFFVQAKVVPEACGLALREISGELDRMAGEKVSTFELEQAKSYLIGSFPLQISRLDDLARRASDHLALSLSEEHWSGFYDTIMLVDADRVFEVAQKYLLPKPVVVIVGSSDVLSESLRELGEFEVYDAKGAFLYRVVKGVQE